MSIVSVSPLRATLGLVATLILACGPFASSDTPETPADTPAGQKPAAGGHSASGASGAGPSGDPTDLACDPKIDTPTASGCAIRPIQCGETIEANNADQSQNFDDAFYRAKFCTPRSANYAAGREAIYNLHLPANMRATVRLESPCANLDLFSIRWPHADRCPNSSTSTGECEGSTKPGVDSIQIVAVGNDEHHLVWVDGQDGDYGNFRLSVVCEPGR